MSTEAFLPLKPILRDDFVRTGYVYDIYDGDTLYYHADLGYDVWAAFQVGRLLDVYAAEVRPLVSRAEGEAARDHLIQLVQRYAINRLQPDQIARIGHELRIRSVQADNKWFNNVPRPKKGKYGRWLVVLLGANDNGDVVNLNEMMVQSGHAKSKPD